MPEDQNPFQEWEAMRKEAEEMLGIDFDSFDPADFAPPPPDPFFEALADPKTTPEQVEAFLQNGEDPNRSRIGQYQRIETPASVAASHPNPSILEMILKAGANPNVSDANGYTPYFNAQTVEKLLLLINHGAIYPEPTSYNETPLNRAYGRLDLEVVQFLINIGVPLSELKATPIHMAVAFNQPLLETALQENPGSLESKDICNDTPLLLAFRLGKIEAISTLLAAGASPKAVDHVGRTCIHFATESDNPEAVKRAESLGFDIAATDNFGYTPLSTAASHGTFHSFNYILEKLKGRPDFYAQVDQAIYSAQNHTIIDALLQVGANHNSLDSESRREMNPSSSQILEIDSITQQQYRQARGYRFGTCNPQECSEPFWQAMIILRFNAYTARQHFGDQEDFCVEADPVWCADRFGQSITPLPDGRTIEIAGEHEDGYDPDFCIYNDVFVHEPGKLPRIFLYPREVFPPTDFHTATLMGDWIYIIGSLGYGEDRNLDKCPVYRLNINTLVIESVETTGEDPGRIYKHRAIKHSESEILVRDGGKTANTQKFDASHPASIFNIESNSWSPFMS